MFNTIRTAALSAIIGLGAISAMPSAAQADGLYLNFGGNNQAGVAVQFGGPDNIHYRHNRYDRRYYRACTPDRAINKAQRLGVRRAHVVDVNRHTIKVAGRKYGDRVRLTFGRAAHCPIVRW